MSQNAAASYARVSSNDQHSLMAQLETIRQFADEQGLEVAREYEDEGRNGQPARVPAHDRGRSVARKALRHHHRLRPLKVFRERLRSHPVQGPAPGSRGQAALRHRACRVLNGRQYGPDVTRQRAAFTARTRCSIFPIPEADPETPSPRGQT